MLSNGLFRLGSGQMINLCKSHPCLSADAGNAFIFRIETLLSPERAHLDRQFSKGQVHLLHTAVQNRPLNRIAADSDGSCVGEDQPFHILNLRLAAESVEDVGRTALFHHCRRVPPVSYTHLDLVAGSFMPPADIRQLRDLMRYRFKLTCFKSSEKNRLQNCLTVSNIQLGNVVSDTFGKSAQAILDKLLENPAETSFDLEPLVYTSLKKKLPELRDAIDSYITPEQAGKLKVIKAHYENLESRKAELEELVCFGMFAITGHLFFHHGYGLSLIHI